MMEWKKLIREVAWVTMLALALACSAYALRPKLLPVMPSAGDAGVANPGEAQVPRIDLEAAILHFEQSTAIFVDARSSHDFNAGHISGALHLAPQAFDEWSGRLFSEIDPDQMIIAYCDGAQCSLSDELAEQLIWLGFENVAVLKDGWRLWQSRNMPVEESRGPSS